MTTIKKTLYISSAQKSSGTNENFIITTPSGLFESSPKKVRVISATIPFNFNNLVLTNNTLVFYQPGTSQQYTATVPIANYTGTTLAAALQSAMNTVSSGYVVTYSSSPSLTFTISNTSTFQLLFSQSTGMASLLGFTSINTVQSTSFTSTTTPNLVLDYDIFICSDLVLGCDNGVTILNNNFNNNGIMAVANINACYGSLIHYCGCEDTPFYPCSQSNFANGTNTINVYLQFPSGTPVSLNGLGWALTILFEF